jgi:hypothetical protein
MNIDRKIRSTTATGLVLGVVLVVASMNLFTPQASATVEDRTFTCPDGDPGPPCGRAGETRTLVCPDRDSGPPCGPPGRDTPRD